MEHCSGGGGVLQVGARFAFPGLEQRADGVSSTSAAAAGSLVRAFGVDG